MMRKQNNLFVPLGIDICVKCNNTSDIASFKE